MSFGKLLGSVSERRLSLKLKICNAFALGAAIKKTVAFGDGLLREQIPYQNLCSTMLMNSVGSTARRATVSLGMIS